MFANHTLFHSIHQLSRFLIKHVNHALQPYGLYSAQWSVIYVLKTKGKMKQTDLCEYLSIEAPPLTRTIQRLVKLNYVTQTPGNDRRYKIIDLTEKAHEEYPKWEQAVSTVNKSLLEKFPSQSQQLLEQLVQDWLVILSCIKETNDE